MASGTEERLRQYLKRVTVDLGQTRQRLREAEERFQEPVAVVSMACRFPGGVGSPEELWELVASGGDAIGDFPADRGWDLTGLYDPDPDHPGTSYVRSGGFLYDADRFDAEFFGISPREALAMDPQQRLLLETSWEVLERAGIDPKTLKGTATGVYAGAGLPGFDPLQSAKNTEGHLLTGNALSVLSGRVAFTLGLEGPALSVDTACSSSLVAIHLAGQALRQGECSLALAGGVTVMATPFMFTEFSRQRGLAPDGRCKPFADAADGTGFAEGVGLVLLERLSDTRRNGHQVLAVIRGSAINQDGASNGLTAPKGTAQERVIRQALAAAGLSAAEVDVVEAHGTGTQLGDPIEAGALLATYGQNRPEDRPLWLGSVKSNIGHTQGAAGVAGVIKMVMALRHGVLPASLHINEPTAQVDWSSGAVRLLTKPVDWHRGERIRRAGVSAFGMSGTNAHVILEQAPELGETAAAGACRPEPAGGVVPWAVTARSSSALQAQAQTLAKHVAQRPGARVVDVGWSLATTRSTLEHRAVVLGEDSAQLTAGLAALATGAMHPALVGPGPAVDSATTCPVLVFPGQGSQWVGMGADLLDCSPVFATRIAECQHALAPYVDWSLTEVLRGVQGGAELSRVDVVQPTLWAIMVALAAVWAAYGVVPAAVVGHSQGEIAAACVAGALSLDEAARVVALRSQALSQLCGGGAMASLGVGSEAAARLVVAHGAEVVVAAVNGPSVTVVSGPPEQVATVVAAAQTQGLRARMIEVDYASHGPQIDQIADELTQQLTNIHPVSTSLGFYSTVTGSRLDTAGLDTNYWVTNLRWPVRFADAVTALLSDGYRIFIETSPHPVLTLGLQDCFDHAATTATGATVIPTLRRDHGGQAQLLHALSQAFTAGAPVNWAAWFPTNPTPQVIDLPTYAFQCKRFWMEGRSMAAGDPASFGLICPGHPLLGAAVEPAAEGTYVLAGRLSAGGGGWLADHRVLDRMLLPGAALVEWALRAADEVGCGAVTELVLQAPLAVPVAGGVRVQVSVAAAGADGLREVRMYSQAEHDDDGTGWVCHAVGVLGPGTPDTGTGEQGGTWPPPGARPVDVSGFYQRASAAGYDYGPAFQGLHAVWRDGPDLLAEVALPEAAGDCEGFGIHPALLDAALHPVLLIDEWGADDRVWLPFAWTGVSLWAGKASTVRVRLTPLRSDGGDQRSLRVAVFDSVGAPVLSADSVVLHPADPQRLRMAGGAAQSLFTLDWTALPSDAEPPGTDTGDWAVLGQDTLGLAAASYPTLDELAAALDAGTSSPPVVLAAISPGGDGLEAVQAALRLVQGWLAEPRLAGARLVVLTRGAVACDFPDLAGAAVWGLVRSAQSEQPGRFFVTDLDLGSPELGSAGIAEAVRRAVVAGEPQVAVRDGRLLVPRLVATGTRDDSAGPPTLPPLDPEGTVLITGGTGTVGSAVAEHLVRAWGVRQLLLISRRGCDAPGARALADRLTALGASVRIVAADVADPAAVADLVEGIDPAHRLTGVVHAAGALDDAVIAAQSPQRLATVWAAKAAGAANLHAATAELPLEMFVVFSSAAACLGNVGQTNYAAANAFCDALATRRHALGLPGLSIGWGRWAEASGMTRHLTETDLARLSRLGGRSLGTDQALALLDVACRHGDPYLFAAELDRRVLAARPADTLPAPLRAFGGITARQARRAAARDSREISELAARLARLDPAARLDAMLGVVRESVAGVLGYRSATEVRAEASFKDAGFDSLMAVELSNRLSAVCGVRLPATLVFDHPTPRALAEHLGTRLSGQATTADIPVAAVNGVPGAGEPVAIVAMACRYPGGVGSPEQLWDLVASGGDAIGEFPAGRGWDLASLFHPDPDYPGTSYVREGGFVRGAELFDAAFFEVNPREAVAMDPQQRLLLETSWEVLERAGIDPASLKGSKTGVYAGVMYHDYGIGMASGDAQLEGYAMFAGSGSVVSGRVAYTLGLEGPAVTVDTACSSSLVAMHLAAQALRLGECDLALAGGVTVLATPDVFTVFSRQRGLAPDGRCKPFAAAADGTAWGEGVGLVVLERLSDARRHGRRVLAVVRGSAVNQDGASNGITAPNGPSQQRVIAQALANARLSAAEVDAVEGHGTGTTLGDPIEAQALLATYGQGRPAGRPLWLGSVKSNLGHTQAAAGVAGVIKMVLAMQRELLPASLHIDEPSPHVDWGAGAVRLLTEPVEWPRGERPRRAGVSSFGFSGTNAHLIIEEAAEPGDRPEPVRVPGVVPWVLSARGSAGLRGQAAALAARVAEDAQLNPAEVGWSLVTTRSRLDHRAVVLGEDRDQLLAGVRALAAGEMHQGVIPPAADMVGKTVFLFSGQGSQRPGMGAGLHQRFPLFATVFDEVCELLDEHLEHPIREVVLTGLPAHEDLLDHTTYAQAGLFALHVALARLLDSMGLRPDVVIGHSIGEIAAAWVAGVFDLADACRLVAARGTLMGRLPGGGAMASVQASPEELADDLHRHGGRIAVAARNTPESTVISGPAELVSEVSGGWARRGRKTKSLTVSHAFHSPLMEPILEEFTQAVGDLTYRPPAIPLISNVTGLPGDEQMATPGYWAQHIRSPVLFAPAVAHVAAQAGVFLEVGPDPVLATAAAQTLDHLDHRNGASSVERPPPLVLAALSGKQSEVRALSQAMARLHTAGLDIDWTGWFPADPSPAIVDLPTYAFQRRYYWPTTGGGAGDVSAAGLRRIQHALLPAAVALADGGLLLTGRISAAGAAGQLTDHQVLGTVLVPGAALVEWALRAADESGCGGVEELVLEAPLALAESGGVQVQVVVEAAGADGRREVSIYSRAAQADDCRAGDAQWVRHASGVLAPEASAGTEWVEGLGGQWPPPGAQPVDVSGCYERFAQWGYEYGPAFRGLRAVWRDGSDVLAEVVLPEVAGDSSGFGIHPALLDAALHAGLLLDEPGKDDQVRLPFAWTGVTLWAGKASMVRVRLTPVQAGEQGEAGERGVRMMMADATGAAVLSVESVVARPADLDQLKAMDEQGTGGQFVLDWTPLPVPTSGFEAAQLDQQAQGGESWAVLGPDALGLRGCIAHHPDLAALVAGIDGTGTSAPSMVLACVRPSSHPCSAMVSGADADEGLVATEGALELIQGWLAQPHLASARLAVVTWGAVVVSDSEGPPDTAGAAVWALVRSAQLENPGRFILLDADRADGDVAAALRQAVEMDEPQLALRAGRVLVPRLVPVGDGGSVPLLDRAWRLGLDVPGTVDNVSVVACPEVLAPLGSGQVRIGVRAAGINFRDVLVSLGMAPGQTGVGGEGAGVVLELAPDVTGLAVGDRVMGLFEGAFGPIAIADARMLAPIPPEWDWRQAAGVPVAFLTAWFALVELAQLHPGESVLIHTATGGVGMAAVHIARYLGAQIYATASPSKHPVLDDMGIDAAHRASSRDTDFEHTIRTHTHGRGVDVVLNSLAGPFTDASLRLLAPGGRFLDMGKTDPRDPHHVSAQHPAVTYQAFDIIADTGPETITAMWHHLTELFTHGVLHPPPIQAWPLAQARDALRYLSQARHTGKLILDIPEVLNPQGTILITGGTGTLGSLIAEHLARHWNIKHLILVSRRGPHAPTAPDLTARLTELGTHVRILAADISNPDTVSELIASINPAHPLTGIIHTAGTLDDGIVPALTPHRLASVWAAKASAAHHLHHATTHLPLALFVIFSSAAATLGSPGQANYAAANAFCDALMARRRALGLTGISLGWGLWANASGMTEHLKQTDLARMTRSGMRTLSTEQALNLFDNACQRGDPHLLAMNLNLPTLAAQPANTVPPALRALAAGSPGGRPRRTAATVSAQPEDWTARLIGLPAGEQRHILINLVRGQVATVLGHADLEAVQAEASFKELGFDSLTAVELRNRLAAVTGLRLPPALIFDYPQVGVLADQLRRRLSPEIGACSEVRDLEPVLSELARLESTLNGAVLQDGASGAVTARLEALLTQWKATHQRHNGGAVAQRLQAASADQLIDFIDNELGTS